MKRNRSTRNRILMVAVGLLTAAGLAWAQSPSYGPQGQLTDEQALQLEKLRGQYETKMVTLEKQLAAAEIELDRATARPDADTDRVLKLRREVRNLEGQLEDIYLQANAEAAGVMGVPPGASYRDGMGWLNYGHGSSWHGSCAWDSCPWDGAWRDGHRSSRWGRSSSRMGHRSGHTCSGHCCG